MLQFTAEFAESAEKNKIMGQNAAIFALCTVKSISNTYRGTTKSKRSEK
jgi:hypothetical protein